MWMSYNGFAIYLNTFQTLKIMPASIALCELLRDPDSAILL